MLSGCSEATIVFQNLVPADQQHQDDVHIFAFYNILVKNISQRINRRQIKYQYQISEYTITDAYLQYWELLKTKFLT